MSQEGQWQGTSRVRGPQTSVLLGTTKHLCKVECYCRWRDLTSRTTTIDDPRTDRRRTSTQDRNSVVTRNIGTILKDEETTSQTSKVSLVKIVGCVTTYSPSVDYPQLAQSCTWRKTTCDTRGVGKNTLTFLRRTGGPSQEEPRHKTFPRPLEEVDDTNG